ncbi:MAG TPA: outer membrane beta-barrel protein [Segetibacter sp.]
MQADEFEKNIQNKMEGFGLVPNGEVWKQVLIRIEKEKKKRKVVFFWLFTGLVLLAGTSALYFINNENNRKLIINEVKETSRQPGNKIKLTTPNSLANSYKAKAATEKGLKHINKGNIKRVPGSEIKDHAFRKISNAKVINNELNADLEKDNSKVYKKKKQIFQPLLPHKFYKAPAIKTKLDSTLKNSIDEKTNIRKDTSAGKIVKEIRAKKQLNKKWNFGFSVYSGISDNLSDLPFLENYAQDYSASPGFSQGGNNYYLNTSNKFESRFSFGLVIFLEKKLSKKISLTAGADYHLYKAKSTVGNRVRSSTILYDPILQTATSLNEYYEVGNSVTYVNKYHLVELPINLGYQINRNQDKPLMISAGLSPGYLVSSNALYKNPSANVYYVDKQKFKRFQLSAQMGLSFPIIGSLRYLLSGGPVIQYGFTSVVKAVSGIDQHLFFTGVNANFILK